jgi:predicted DNA-binding protein YlxM (UPF0122 family)
MDIEKKELINILYSYYSSLLSPKQKEYLDLYALNDYSLSEIASSFKISRVAVFDSLHQAVDALETFEDKLKLYQKSKIRKELYEKIDASNCLSIVTKLKELEDD